MTRWWKGDARERYWLEATDRKDIGTDLRAPMTDNSGVSNWRYALFRDAQLGDVVFHYDSRAGAITSRSVIAGPAFEQPIVWAARGSYARERGAVPVEVPGYAIPLRDHSMLDEPLTLERLRDEKAALSAIDDALRAEHPRRPLYFPFELSSRPVRPMQGYAFKLPAAFVTMFGLNAEAEPASVLTIIRDRRKVAALYRRWRAAMMDGAVRGKGLWVQSADRFVFRNQDERRSTSLGARTALGIDPSGRDWAVQINEAKVPGDLDVTSAVALDTAGRPFLLRQGRLSANAVSRKPILYDEFARLTGLSAAQVRNGDTAIPRDWYVVTPLDVDAEKIRRFTARFVDECAAARRAAARNAGAAEDRLAVELGSGDELGGFYTAAARPALPERQLRRLQGEVWIAMAALLRGAGLEVAKPRHRMGYEVDAEIVGEGCRLLVEIKSGAGAADVHTGVGQLLLYPALLPRLSDHRRVLMLPDLPGPALADAIAACGITLCTYQMVADESSTNVRFSAKFLNLCGLSAKYADGPRNKTLGARPAHRRKGIKTC